MSTAYQPYAIKEFKTGTNNYLQPWIRPADAFEPLINGYVYRGVISKRNGYSQFGSTLSDTNPVMGLIQYQDEQTGAVSLLAASTQNLYLYNSGSNEFDALTDIVEYSGSSPIIQSIVFWKGTATGTLVIPTFFQNLVYSSINITDGTTVLTSDISGNLTDGGIFASGGTINLTTGIATLNFTGSTDNVSLSINASTSGNYFTGTIKNFFNWCNWQAIVGAASYIYMTNNIDPITTFDGTDIQRPQFLINSTSGSKYEYITTALDVKIYQNRLLIIQPTLSVNGIQGQSIYWSAEFDPFNFIQITGSGGFLAASTGDFIISTEFVRDVLIVFFTNSIWRFRYTGDQYNPFIFERISASKSTNTPYGTVAYDERATTGGNTGLLSCDAVNVQRYDLPIIDYYETQFSEEYYSQTFSQRYDNLNQTWMLYVSTSNPLDLIDSVAPGSDRALIYNFIENTWATYEFEDYMTCLGLFYKISGTTWADLDIPWSEAEFTWSSYASQSSSPILLSGDTVGNVWYLDDPQTISDGQINVDAEVIATGDGGATYTGATANIPILYGTFTATDSVETFLSDEEGILTGSLGGTGSIDYSTGFFYLTFASAVAEDTPITANYISGTAIDLDIVSTRWNPLIDSGQKIQFGYIDIYYQVVSNYSLDPVTVTLLFFVDNSDSYAITKTLTLDGPTNSQYAFKRIYANLIGQFIRMEIDPDKNAAMQFLGFVLWVRPAGRLTGP